MSHYIFSHYVYRTITYLDSLYKDTLYRYTQTVFFFLNASRFLIITCNVRYREYHAIRYKKYIVLTKIVIVEEAYESLRRV